MKYWIAVASKQHVAIGVKEGIMQVCHGKQAPLKKVHPGDLVIYYSPTEMFGQKIPCRAFTAIGRVHDGALYQYVMSDNFMSWRRDVTFFTAHDAAIEPLIQHLSFIKNKQHWGMFFRYGLFAIAEKDFILIASHMGVNLS